VTTGGTTRRSCQPTPSVSRAALRALGLVIAIVCLNCRRSAQADAEDKLAAKALASAAEREQVERLFRLHCKVDEGPIFPVDDEGVKSECHTRISQTQSTAFRVSFPMSEDDATTLTSDDGCRRTFVSYFDARSHDASTAVRTNYDCTYEPRSGTYVIRILAPHAP
jgi:hypothetical protein